MKFHRFCNPSIRGNFMNIPVLPCRCLSAHGFRTPRSPFMYQAPFPAVLVHLTPLSCTEHRFQHRWYTNGFSHVPTIAFSIAGTPEVLSLYKRSLFDAVLSVRKRFSVDKPIKKSRFVHRKVRLAGESHLVRNSVRASLLFDTFEIEGIFVIVLVVISSPFKWLARVILSVFLVAKTEIGS